MPDLLGPTNPVPGYDTNPVRVTVPQPGDTSIRNIVDPTRVTRPDQRTDRQEDNDAGGATRYESNFMTFLQRLRETRRLPDTFLRVLQWGGAEVTSGIREGFARELAEFMEFLQMDEAGLLDFLQNQMQSGARFSGALFQLLRDAYRGSTSELTQNEILQFLRRYSDFSSTEHLEDKILRFSAELSEAMPSPWSGDAANLAEQLQQGVENGDRQGNLNLLRGELFPLVARYVSTTHDHGRARAILSMMALDVARYENGAEEGLVQSFRHLVSSGVLPEELGRQSDAEILQLLSDMEYARAADRNDFAQHLAALTDRALQGEGGVNAQEAFQNILAAILTNESVFMPLNHAMLPLDWHGKKAFSEIWLDPDADNGGENGRREHRARLLIKMDIESVGAFDLLFNTRGQNVSLQVGCPKSVVPLAGDVAASLSAILSRNGLGVDEVRVAEMKRPLSVSEVFPKVLEKMSGVNVRA